MGSPKARRKQKIQLPHLTEPKLGEKLKLFGIAPKLQWHEPERVFIVILDHLKEFLLPMVQWLDTDLTDKYPFNTSTSTFGKKRGMLVFEGYGRGLPSFGLERNGQWVVNMWIKNREVDTFSVQTQNLARILSERINDLTRAAIPARCDSEVFKKFVASYFARMICQRTVVWLLEQCFENLKKELAAREERINHLRDRIKVLAEFGHSIDPLLRANASVSLTNHAIYRSTGRGETNDVSGYLHANAIEPFWELVRKGPDAKDCRPVVQDWTFNSLQDVFFRLSCLCESVDSAQKDGRTTAEKQRFINSGRLPLIKEEEEALSQLSKKIILVEMGNK